MGAATELGEFTGTAMQPGISLNRRMYTKAIIGDAVARAQERLAAGTDPMTMLTHHEAEDDSTRIVGRITAVWQEKDGSARYRAELADTPEADKIAQLIAPQDGRPPFLNSVSIRGWWLGEVRTERAPDGGTYTIADGLEINGIDFTKDPGVTGARIDPITRHPQETAEGRVLIYESASVDAPAPAPQAKAAFADLGYRGTRRFPLDTVEAARRSWNRVNDPTETAGYTPAQIKRIRSRTKAALKEYGVAHMPKPAAATTTRFDHVKEFYGDGGDAGLSVCAYNGPLTINVSAYGIDADQLQSVADAAMNAAMTAFAALDSVAPDEPEEPEEEPDGDEPDGDEAPAEPDDDETDDNQMETRGRPGGQVTETPRPRTPAAATTRREPNVAPTNKAAETAAPNGMFITNDQLAQIIEAARGGAPAAEAAPAKVEETAEERQARLIGEAVTAAVATAMEDVKDDLRADMQAAGPSRVGRPTRKTLEAIAEVPDKPLHELSGDDFNKTAERGFAAALGINID